MEVLVVVISVLVLLLLIAVGYVGLNFLKEYLQTKFAAMEERFNGISNQLASVSDKESALKDMLKTHSNDTAYLSFLVKHIQKIEAPVRKNDIEKREPEEVPLDETMRIPIIDGVNVKMENENQSYPIDIITYGEKD